MSTPLGSSGHISHPEARPAWSTVSVEAETATLADALSTALVLADLEQVKRLRMSQGVRSVTLVDAEGDLMTL